MASSCSTLVWRHHHRWRYRAHPGCRSGQAQVPSSLASFSSVIVNLNIGGWTHTARICPDDLVVSIHERQQNYGVESLVVVIQGATVWWTLIGNMFSIQRTTGVRKPLLKLLSYGMSTFRSGVADYHLVRVFVDDGPTEVPRAKSSPLSMDRDLVNKQFDDCQLIMQNG